VDDLALQTTFDRASVLALATRYEGYDIVLSEAMLHGLPVVSCPVGAVSGTVALPRISCRPDDPEAFAAALRAHLGNPDVMAQSAQASSAGGIRAQLARYSLALCQSHFTGRIMSCFVFQPSNIAMNGNLNVCC
jgi:glycosyltransferase involved in cell wall biosynthesis